jgi:hypothetical protein
VGGGNEGWERADKAALRVRTLRAHTRGTNGACVCTLTINRGAQNAAQRTAHSSRYRERSRGAKSACTVETLSNRIDQDYRGEGRPHCRSVTV